MNSIVFGRNKSEIHLCLVTQNFELQSLKPGLGIIGEFDTLI